MVITEMTDRESLELLARVRLGRLACSQGSQPYVVPFYFYYHEYSLYSISALGQKIEWMRANPLVCVEADEIIAPQKWQTVIVFGSYEELPDTPEGQYDQHVAWNLLKEHAMWWEPALEKASGHGAARPIVPVFYRIHILQITGRHASSGVVV